MSIFDRFKRNDESWGRNPAGQPAEPSEDEQALARYRYMLKTAPPETIEQAHVEAFSKLTPQQRQMLLEQLLAESPETERAYASENPQALARLATRAEVRQPGIMERLFSGTPSAAAGAGPGFGGMIGSSLLGSMAGTVLGTMIAQNFLGSHGMGHGDLGGHAHGSGLFDSDNAQVADQAQDAGSDMGDIDSVLGDFGSSDFGDSTDI